MESWKKVVIQLDKQISAGNVNSYYETVFADMVSEKSLNLKSISFDSKPWYEIDTLEDLSQAEKIFPFHRHEPAHSNVQSVQKRFLNQLVKTIPTVKRATGVLSAAK
jgi:NDP-sugar pyrophosphorylase family protein